MNMKYIEILTSENILNILNSWSSNEEMQAIFFLSLCGLGAWVVISWIIQIIRSILWICPLMIIVAVLLSMPSLRGTLTEEIIPKQIDGLMENILENKHINNHYENATLHWFT